MAQLVARRLAVRHARVRFSAWHHREVFPTELTSNEEMERGPGEWRRMSVIECMHVCYKILKINKKTGIIPPNPFDVLSPFKTDK